MFDMLYQGNNLGKVLKNVIDYAQENCGTFGINAENPETMQVFRLECQIIQSHIVGGGQQTRFAVWERGKPVYQCIFENGQVPRVIKTFCGRYEELSGDQTPTARAIRAIAAVIVLLAVPDLKNQLNTNGYDALGELVEPLSHGIPHAINNYIDREQRFSRIMPEFYGS